jgi:hypothetical protein
MKTHAIYWKSAVSGQIGTGTKLFEKKEAERLATELNEDYPDIDREAISQRRPMPGRPPCTSRQTVERQKQLRRQLGSAARFMNATASVLWAPSCQGGHRSDRTRSSARPKHPEREYSTLC